MPIVNAAIRGEAVSREWLKSYREALAQYHLHPEPKFHNGNYLDTGFTHRRHVVAAGVVQIGKEANRWEEQFYLGEDPEAQIEYGAAPEDTQRVLGSVLRACQGLKVRELARASGVSLGEVSNVLRGVGNPNRAIVSKIQAAAMTLRSG
jgi:hypothetical protein